MAEFLRRPAKAWDQYSWAEVFAGVVRYTAQPHENIEDIVAGGWVLGEHRARVIGRDFEIPQDVPSGLSIFCFWPFKPSRSRESREFLLGKRGELFAGASGDEGVRNRLIEIVPDDLLKLELYQLFELLHTRPVWELIRL